MSDVVPGKIEPFGIEVVANMAAASGRHVDKSIRAPEDERRSLSPSSLPDPVR